jgi:mitogen-activated protein kinase kinase kinase ANP1
VQVENFKREVAVMKNLQHENIVQYRGTSVEDDDLNIFLEYVPGGSISALLSKFGSFNEQVIRVYTRQILLGLEYLHSHHIMHRGIP